MDPTQMYLYILMHPTLVTDIQCGNALQAPVGLPNQCLDLEVDVEGVFILPDFVS